MDAPSARSSALRLLSYGRIYGPKWRLFSSVRDLIKILVQLGSLETRERSGQPLGESKS
jgi:hypothetical protein